MFGISAVWLIDNVTTERAWGFQQYRLQAVWNLASFHLSTASFIFHKSLINFAQSMAVMLLCCMPNFGRIHRLIFIWWPDDILWVFSSTHEWLEMHGCVLSTVAIDALVLNHQAITIHNVDRILIVLGMFQWNITFVNSKQQLAINDIVKKIPSYLRVKMDFRWTVFTVAGPRSLGIL